MAYDKVTLERKQTVRHHLEVLSSRPFVVIIRWQDKKKKSKRLVSAKEWKMALEKYKGSAWKASNYSFREYRIFKTEFWAYYDRHGHTRDDFFWKFDLVEDPEEAIKKGIDKSRVAYFECDSYLFYGIDRDVPISPVYHFGYIGGVTNDKFHLGPAKNILDEQVSSGRVWDVQCTEIPYYNREEGYSRAIEFMGRVPQQTFTKMWRYFENKKFSSSCVKSAMTPRPWDKHPFDPFKLRPAMKPNKENN